MIRDEETIRISSEEAHNAPIESPQIDLSVSPQRAVLHKPIWPWVLIALAACGLIAGAVVLLLPAPVDPQGMTATVVSSPDNGLSREQLVLSSPQMFGGWIEDDGALGTTANEWSGSCAVVERRKGKLWLATNSHCLGLFELAMSGIDLDSVLDVKDYRLMVQFPTGKVKQVLRFGDQLGDLDLALLEVDATELVEGVDYVILPAFLNLSTLNAGDDVVAVGSPYGLFGTQTFGKISAIRTSIPGSLRCNTVQVDAAINPGNSGGPLFLRENDRYCWIGINTQRAMDPTTGAPAAGIGFAIHVSELLDSKYVWHEANAKGAAKALKEFHHSPAESSSP